MADSKITALTSIGTSTDPAVDPLVLVDVSDTSMAATGTTKKVTLNNLLSSSPTAGNAFTVSGLLTAGSATITGDLTVDTSTLKVDSVNDRVGIGTASPGTARLTVARANTAVGTRGTIYAYSTDSFAINLGGQISFGGSYTGTSETIFGSVAGRKETANDLDISGYLQFSTTNVFTGNVERMRLDSSGNLGLGVTPSAWDAGLSAFEMKSGSVLGFAGSVANFTSNAYYQGAWKYKTSAAAAYYQQANGSHNWQIASSGTAGNAITFTQAMTLDASGNLLVGGTTNTTSARYVIQNGTSNGVQYSMLELRGGSGSGANQLGLIRRQTTASVANSAATIYGTCTFGELMIVTGVGGGAIFSDLLMVSYNTVAVISSNTQQGSPAARTYSISSGNLQLTMGSATSMAITAQSFTAGALGA